MASPEVGKVFLEVARPTALKEHIPKLYAYVTFYKHCERAGSDSAAATERYGRQLRCCGAAWVARHKSEFGTAGLQLIGHSRGGVPEKT